jgi:hypothetical protein
MPWLKMTDTFWTNPKLERLSDKAHRLYVRSLGYSAQYLTDGLLDATALRTLGATPRLCDELTTPDPVTGSACWTALPGEGYVIHDYLDFNPSREQVAEKRRQDAARQSKRRTTANQHPDTGRFIA